MSKNQYSNELIRFHTLMNINESDGFKETPINQHRLFKNTVKLAPDGRVYGVVQEGNKYFIKTTLLEEGKKLDAADFSYLGGIQNPLKGRYNSYNDALKRLNEGIISEQNIIGDIDQKSKLLFESYIKEADEETVVDEPAPETETESKPEAEPEATDEPAPEAEPEMVDEPAPEAEPEREPEMVDDVDTSDEVELGDDEQVDMSDEGGEDVEANADVSMDVDSEDGTEGDEDDIKALAGKFVAEIQRPDIDDNEKIESINQMVGNLFGYLKKNTNVKEPVVAKIQEKIEEINSSQDEVQVGESYHMNEAKKKQLKSDVMKMVNEAAKYNPKVKVLLEKLEKVKSKKLIKESTKKKSN